MTIDWANLTPQDLEAIQARVDAYKAQQTPQTPQAPATSGTPEPAPEASAPPQVPAEPTPEPADTFAAPPAPVAVGEEPPAETPADPVQTLLTRLQLAPEKVALVHAWADEFGIG